MFLEDLKGSWCLRQCTVQGYELKAMRTEVLWLLCSLRHPSRGTGQLCSAWVAATHIPSPPWCHSRIPAWATLTSAPSLGPKTTPALHTEVPDQIACPRSDTGLIAQGGNARHAPSLSSMSSPQKHPPPFPTNHPRDMTSAPEFQFYAVFKREHIPIPADEPETIQIKPFSEGVQTSLLCSSGSRGMAASVEEEEEEERSLLCAAVQSPQGRGQAARWGGAGLQPVTVQTLMLQKLILQSSTLRTLFVPGFLSLGD